MHKQFTGLEHFLPVIYWLFLQMEISGIDLLQAKNIPVWKKDLMVTLH